MTTTRVKEWMTTDPITVYRGANLSTVRMRMHRDEIRRLLVVESDGRLAGVVTRGNVMEAWPSRFSSLEPYEVRELMARVAVDEIMVTDVVNIDPEATIAEAANLMFEHRIGALPVVEDGRVVGILTNSDILQGLVRILSGRE